QSLWDRYLAYLSHLLLDRPRALACSHPDDRTTVPHLFLRFFVANRTWAYFCSAAGISVEGLHLHQIFLKWWNVDVLPRVKPIFWAIPSIIVWELWKKRNADKHGTTVTTSRIIYQVSTTIQQLVKLRKPGIKFVPHRWPEIMRILENFTPKLKYTKIMWNLPPMNWWK
ncbi:hypothetical protein HAX54_029202, partial [Datura stramonium]|nr:hypothetical protein [Datura stramonium]